MAWARLRIAGLVLLGEYLAISFCFDAQTALYRGGPWVAFSKTGTVGLIAALSGLFGLILIAGLGPLDDSFAALPVPTLRPRGLAFHAIFFSLFFCATWLLFGRPAAPAGSAEMWLLLWAFLGLASVLLLLAALVGTLGYSTWTVLLVLAASCGSGVVAWTAGDGAQRLWKPFGYATLASTAAVLRVGFNGVSADFQQMTLALGDFAVQVAPICSGFEGMGLMVVVLGAYVLLFRKELLFPQAWLLFPIGLIAVWLGNVARLTGLMVLGAKVSPELALGGFHSKAGWVFFCAITLLIGHVGRRSRFFSTVVNPPEPLTENPTAIYLLPLLVLLATGLLTATFAENVDRLYGLRLVLVSPLLLALRRHYPERIDRNSWSWFAVLAGALVAAVWLIIPSSGSGDPTVLAAMHSESSWAWLAVRTLGSITVVPICEELAFRGFLMRWIVSRDFTRVSLHTWTPVAVLGSSLAFGLLHQRWVLGSIAGLVYAVVQVRKGSTWNAVVAHAVSNAAIAAYVLVSGDFSHWL